MASGGGQWCNTIDGGAESKAATQPFLDAGD
jgi:hypothetical protein